MKWPHIYLLFLEWATVVLPSCIQACWWPEVPHLGLYTGLLVYHSWYFRSLVLCLVWSWVQWSFSNTRKSGLASTLFVMIATCGDYSFTSSSTFGILKFLSISASLRETHMATFIYSAISSELVVHVMCFDFLGRDLCSCVCPLGSISVVFSLVLKVFPCFLIKCFTKSALRLATYWHLGQQ